MSIIPFSVMGTPGVWLFADAARMPHVRKCALACSQTSHLGGLRLPVDPSEFEIAHCFSLKPAKK